MPRDNYPLSSRLQRLQKAEFLASLAVYLLKSKASTGTEYRDGEWDRKPGEQRS